MEKYNDIGDFYKEMFSDYAPEPPASIWENVHSAIEAEQSMWKKLKRISIFFASAIIAVSAIIYLFIVPDLKLDESATVTLNDTRENVENKDKEAGYEKLISANLPDVSNEKTEYVFQQANTVKSQNDGNISHVSNNPLNNNLTEHSPSETVTQTLTDDKKGTPAITSSISAEQVQEKNTLKTAQDESRSKKRPIISKDTSICENTAAKLYVHNVENIRWSTGETKNIITVHPSSEEHYSVTFSTENTKDTTVYIHVKVVPCLEIHIPNAFTPNGDGLNDFFLAKTDMALESFEMIIYSAHGRQILFSSKDINHGWDGTYKGQTQAHGLYYYTIRYIDNFGKTIEKHGELLLINP